MISLLRRVAKGIYRSLEVEELGLPAEERKWGGKR
jgi:hypothetical protein